MNNKTIKIVKSIGIFSLIAYPSILIIAFAYHYKNFADFFVFKFKYTQVPVADSVTMLMSEEATRNFIAPHTIANFAVPFMIFAALTLGLILLKQKPITAIIGSIISIVGAVFLSGVFAAWLSFSAIGNMPTDMYDSALIAFTELTGMQGPLLLITSLSVLGIVGFLILSFGLFRSSIIPKWSSILIFIGHLIIIIFMDLDNLMLIGAVLILIGFHPVISVLKNSEYKLFPS